MSKSQILFATLALTLSACAIPGLSASSGFTTSSAAPSPMRSATSPTRRAPSSPPASSSQSDDAIRAEQSRQEHARLDAQETQYEHDSDRNYNVPPEVDEAHRVLALAQVATDHHHLSGTTMRADATKCAAYVQAHPPTTQVNVHIHDRKTPMSLADVDAKICQPLLASSQGWDELGAKEEAADQAAEERRFASSGSPARS